jgi:hypothetical protein
MIFWVTKLSDDGVARVVWLVTVFRVVRFDGVARVVWLVTVFRIKRLTRVVRVIKFIRVISIILFGFLNRESCI